MSNDLLGLRYTVDFILVPTIFMNNPGACLDIFKSDRAVEFIQHIFNTRYEGVKTFKLEEFALHVFERNGVTMFYYTLPSDNTGSLVWCDAYCFAFVLDDENKGTCQFFTVESTGSTYMLCGMDHKMSHLNFGNAGKSIEENIEKIVKIMNPKQNVVL